MKSSGIFSTHTVENFVKLQEKHQNLSVSGFRAQWAQINIPLGRSRFASEPRVAVPEIAGISR